jgi:hypothetical protein
MNALKRTIAVATMLLLNVVVYAQPGSGGFGDEPNDVPLDGGIIILAIASAGYGAKKLANRKYKK